MVVTAQIVNRFPCRNNSSTTIIIIVIFLLFFCRPFCLLSHLLNCFLASLVPCVQRSPRIPRLNKSPTGRPQNLIWVLCIKILIVLLIFFCLLCKRWVIRNQISDRLLWSPICVFAFVRLFCSQSPVIGFECTF